MTSTVLLLFTVGSLIVVLALLILFHHNINATKGYNLRSLEHVRNDLLLKQEVLNMEIAKAQALNTIQTDGQVKAMQKISKPKYVKEAEAVAQKIE